MPRTSHTLAQVMAALKNRGSQKNREAMARFGINAQNALGISLPQIRALAGTISRDHALAQQLWESGMHEARILAGLVDDPKWVTPAQMNAWTAGFDSWDVCDQICGNLWDATRFADEKIIEWAGDEREFVKRAAFATMAWKAVHDKKASDADLLPWLALIQREAGDNRNFVKKAVSWALRQTGKRSAFLHGPCLELARKLSRSTDKTARWIGSDAVRELDGEKVRAKLGI